MRKLASPGVFTTMLINAARKKGRIVYRHDGPSSFVCGDCGTHTYVSDRKELYFTCAGCDSVHDQDVNAARTICAAAVASADVVAADGAALAHVLPTTYIGRWERSKAAKAAKAGGLASDEKPS
jgi:transposase